MLPQYPPIRLNVIYNHSLFLTVIFFRKETYVVWYKSNETGNAVHEPTMLLHPPSHGS